MTSWRSTRSACAERIEGRRGAGFLVVLACLGLSELGSAQGRYQHEPRIDQLLAVVYAQPPLDPARARQLARRARRGGWLPTMRVALRRGQARDYSSQLDDTPDLRLSTDDDLVLEASLVFRLDRAAYGADEVALAREERSRELMREQRVRTVIAAFFERRRLQLERDLDRRGDAGRELRIRELEALLDAFTSGAFSRMMHARRVR